MNERNYIITFDEYGQPYIAHISWRGVKTMASGRVSKGASRGMQGVGRGVRTAHKYIEKWGEGAKARYFYTQEELKAALQQGRQKASQAVSNARQAVGNAAARGRAALTTASDNVRSATSSVTTKARDLSTRTSSILQKHGSETLSAIKSGASAVRDRAKELADKAGEKVSSTAAAEKVKIGVEKAAEKAKTMAESAAEKAKIGAESAAEKVKIGAEKAAERVKGTAQSVVNKAKDVAGADEYQRYEEAFDRTSAAKDRLAANPNSAYAQREVDRAEEAEAKAHEEYLKTPLGRLNDAKSRVQEVAQYAAERAKELADKASSSDRAKFSEYSRFDRDFDEKHYSEENAVGDTDFYAYKRGDGKTVILEEDMKWVLPKGVDPDSPEIKSALEKVSRDIAENGWRGDEWVDNVTEAINEAAEKARNK